MNSYIKKKIIAQAAPLFTRLGVHHLFRPFYGGMGHILTLHRVIPKRQEKRVHNHLSLEITPEHLEIVIEYFQARDYDFYTIDQLYLLLLQKRKPQKPFVVFTFDDGYKDNYTHAYPIFKKHNIPFTIYVTTHFIDRKAVIWWYALEDLILCQKHIRFQWQSKQYHFSCSNMIEKEIAFDKIRSFINQSFDLDTYEQLFQSVLNTSIEELYQYASKLMLTWDDLHLLNANNLVTIGAHTCNHFPLRCLSYEHMIQEVDGSRNRLEQQLCTPVEHFAYGFGKKEECSIREFEALKLLNFKTAVTTRIGNIFGSHHDHLHAIPRISINSVTFQAILNLQTSGMIAAIYNKGKRQVTD